MESRKLHDWLQVLGLFGVLGGLIFVGLQLLLDRRLSMVQGTEAARESRQYWTEIINANGNADIWVKGLAGEPLTTAESVRFDALASTLGFIYFNNYSRAVRGVSNLVPERFVIEFVDEIHGYPGFERWLAERQRLESMRNERLGSPDGDWSTAVMDELRRRDLEGSQP